MVSGGINGVCSNEIGAEFLEERNIALAYARAREGIYEAGLGGGPTSARTDILLIGDTLDVELSAVGFEEEFVTLRGQVSEE